MVIVSFPDLSLQTPCFRAISSFFLHHLVRTAVSTGFQNLRLSLILSLDGDCDRMLDKVPWSDLEREFSLSLLELNDSNI